VRHPNNLLHLIISGWEPHSNLSVAIELLLDTVKRSGFVAHSYY
jgi:hypothetical protein